MSALLWQEKPARPQRLSWANPLRKHFEVAPSSLRESTYVLDRSAELAGLIDIERRFLSDFPVILS